MRALEQELGAGPPSASQIGYPDPTHFIGQTRSSGLAAFSGRYYATAVLTEESYREEFLDDLQTTLHETFADRARYLEARAAASAS